MISLNHRSSNTAGPKISDKKTDSKGSTEKSSTKLNNEDKKPAFKKN